MGRSGRGVGRRTKVKESGKRERWPHEGGSYITLWRRGRGREEEGGGVAI